FARSSKRASITLMSATSILPNSQKKLKQSKMQMLQSITRTLSPPKTKASTKPGSMRSPRMLPTPPESPKGRPCVTDVSDRQDDDFVDVQLTESEKQFIRLNEPLQEYEENQIGAYFTNLSQTPLDASSHSHSEGKRKLRMLRDTPHWQEFFKIGKNDFERERKAPPGHPHPSVSSVGRTFLVKSLIPNLQDQPQTTSDNITESSRPSSVKRVKSQQVASSSSPPEESPEDTPDPTEKILESEAEQPYHPELEHDRRKVEIELGLSPGSADIINRLTTDSGDTSDNESNLHPSPPKSPTEIASPTSTSPHHLPSTTSSSTARDQKITVTRPSSELSKRPVDEEHGSEAPQIKSATRQRCRTTVEDFEILSVLGKGCAGKVLMVKYRKASSSKADRVYAMKSIKKNHVLAHRELQHTLTEQSVLRRVADEPESNPFIVRLWWSFHDKDHLFLVMDFHPGGDLATQLARWGRLGRDRARFYAAEIAEGVISLHRSGVIYRDLKPENILIAFDGHIVLTDFGLSKQFSRNNDGEPSQEEDERTMTFCGTAEYLAPEVLLGEPYSYEVDWWSFGTMLYEMLSGLTPFWSEDHATMYRRVLHDELTFSEDSNRFMDHDTKTLLRGLLQRNPSVRMSGDRIKKHPYFGMIDWDHVRHKRYIPPYVPAVNPNDATDTQNFDETFLAMEPTYVQDDDPTAAVQVETESQDAIKEENEQADDGENVPGKVEPQRAFDEQGRDVFDGYSYLAPRNERDSVIDEEFEDEPSGGHGSDENGTETAPVEAADYSAKSKNLEDAEESLNTTSNSDDPHCSGQSATDESHSSNNGGNILNGDSEEDWDVVDTPEGGEWDTNGRRKKPSNTLFSRGVVDKYKLRMRKINEGPGNANLSAGAHTMQSHSGACSNHNNIVTPFGSSKSSMTPPVFSRSDSVDIQSSSSITQQPSESSENGASSGIRPSSSSTTKPLKRFTLRNKKFSQPKISSDHDRSKKRVGAELERRGILPAGKLIGAHFLKNRSMSNHGHDGEVQIPVPGSEAGAGSKKKLNLNGLLSYSSRQLVNSNSEVPINGAETVSVAVMKNDEKVRAVSET
ncbi:AGC protein kinase, partial [Phakopsora pachyrhizi]